MSTERPPFFADLSGYDAAGLRADLFAAIAVTLLAIPQGIAYAIIAGLPPVMGLYAAILPAIVGSLFRSSRFVIAGPTNAISLLVGSAMMFAVARGWDPVEVAGTLALMVAVFQLGAALLRMSWIVEFITPDVVLGYVTGAGALIAIGQLPNLTGTPGGSGAVPQQIIEWAAGVSATDPRTLGIGLGTAALVILVRHINRQLPAALIVMVIGLAASLALDLRAAGVPVVADLSPIPRGMLPWTPPSLELVPELLGLAVACTVMSIVESTSVARALAADKGDTVRVSSEFTGQGLANLAAAFFGGYPTSGSLTRSALNAQIGARTRLAGVFSGVMVFLVILVAGPLVDHTPIATLAGILIVIAWNLIDVPRIRAVFAGGYVGWLTFTATVVGTWTMRLDYAIYVGVGVSLLRYLHREP